MPRGSDPPRRRRLPRNLYSDTGRVRLLVRLLGSTRTTNHLDIRYQHEILRLVRRLPVTTVVVLHDLNLAARYCDALVMLDAGRVVGTGSPEQVLTVEAVRAVCGMHVERVYGGGRVQRATQVGRRGAPCRAARSACKASAAISSAGSAQVARLDPVAPLHSRRNDRAETVNGGADRLVVVEDERQQ